MGEYASMHAHVGGLTVTTCACIPHTISVWFVAIGAASNGPMCIPKIALTVTSAKLTLLESNIVDESHPFELFETTEENYVKQHKQI
eukprot:m.133598 g.133598  ORF g.133598 m.133598 type:complete len:87 (+) comp29684_c0_seq1:987-1247(+)